MGTRRVRPPGPRPRRRGPAGQQSGTLAVPGPVAAPAASRALSSVVPSAPERHVFAGRYEVLGLVGAGGMGTVYRARDAELDEVVALKLLRREVVDQPGMLDRFRQEVKLARRVTHRNVARAYDIGEHAGEKFMTMEFVEGESLASRLAREGPLPLDMLVEIASECSPSSRREDRPWPARAGVPFSSASCSRRCMPSAATRRV